MNINSVDYEIDVLKSILSRLKSGDEKDRDRAAALAEKVLPLMEAIDRLQQQRIALMDEASPKSTIGRLARAVRRLLH